MISLSREKEVLTIGDALEWGTHYLGKYGVLHSGVDCRFFLSDLLKTSVTKIHVMRDQILARDLVLKYEECLARRARHEPVAYILGEWEFMGRNFKVNTDVLIPRPETEMLVEQSEKWIKKRKWTHPRILDLGTGSGCVGLSLGKIFELSEIVLADISPAALKIARENAAQLKVDSAVFIQTNLFSSIGPDKKGYFDIIVSNPPYVSTADIPHLAEDLFFEPRLALEGGESGTEIIKGIIEESQLYLRSDGILMLEIGFDQGDWARQKMLDEGFFNVEILKDLNGLDRIAIGENRGSI
ncbi:MAG: peptide chain release factor N(5)-glutamine methyltransferase [Elusimicrobiota bacterium]